MVVEPSRHLGLIIQNLDGAWVPASRRSAHLLTRPCPPTFPTAERSNVAVLGRLEGGGGELLLPTSGTSNIGTSFSRGCPLLVKVLRSVSTWRTLLMWE